MKKTEFDVFLSHNSVDKPWVIQLKTDLTRYGLRVWLDKDEIRPGNIFTEDLELALENSRAVALIVSPEALASGWVKEEYSRALSLTKQKDQPLQLIPVVYKKAELPGFLANRNWVDFTDENTYDQKVYDLVWGITNEKPSEVLSFKTDWDICEIKRVTVEEREVWILPKFLRMLLRQPEILLRPAVYRWEAQKRTPFGPETISINTDYDQLIDELKSEEWESFRSPDKEHESLMRHPKVELAIVVSHAEAKVKIDKQIEKGVELLSTDLENKPDIHEAKVRYEIWRALTIELLKQIFNTHDIANESFRGIDRRNEGTDRRKRFQRFFDTYSRAEERAHQRMPVFIMNEEHTEVQELRREFKEYLQKDLDRLRSIGKRLESFPIETTTPLPDIQELGG